ncbi:MAG: YbaB/EbfC family nucleoid-associated protein [Zetaproteobacteria bacterium]|nr:MAG: YbaB/EbfC family nucleoid-associated protein [Zetaproteobacteria bacterium]
MNFARMMQQAKAVQEKMQALQEEVAAIDVAGEAGGGMVTVRMNGEHRVRSVTIDEAIWQERDRALLEDLVAAACNDAAARVDEVVREKQSAAFSGLPLPPGFSL